MTVSALPELSLHHFSVSVPDIETAIEWYSTILGFAVQQRFQIAAIPAKGAFLRRGALRLELWQTGQGATVPQARREPDSDLHSGGTKHVAFTVPNLQQCLTELVSRGVDIAAVQRDPHQPMRAEPDPGHNTAPAFAAFIRDPAGTLIELLDEAGVGRVLPN